MADRLIYSTKGPALGNRDVKAPKSATILALREFTFITIHAWYFTNGQRTTFDPDKNLSKDLK